VLTQLQCSKGRRMKRMAAALLTAVLLGGTAAYAQSSNKDDQRTSGSMFQAPTGHRQPRASDVPNEKNLTSPTDPMSKQDAAVDKKIKSICRGC
jgi:hypothetical protein